MNNSSINDRIMDLMDKYSWMPASIARYVLEKQIDIDRYL